MEIVDEARWQKTIRFFKPTNNAGTDRVQVDIPDKVMGITLVKK